MASSGNQDNPFEDDEVIANMQSPDKAKRRAAHDAIERKAKEIAGKEWAAKLRAETATALLHLKHAISLANDKFKKDGARSRLILDMVPTPDDDCIAVATVRHVRRQPRTDVSTTQIEFAMSGVVNHTHMQGAKPTKLDVLEADFVSTNWGELIDAIILKDGERA